MSGFLNRVKNYFLPTAGNSYRPGIFKRESVIAIAGVLIFLNAAYFVTVFVVFKNNSFLGAVLPGVLTALTNTDRTAIGVGALTQNTLLAAAAQQKANDMAAKGYFSHVTPDGKTPWYWLDQVGYKYTYAGENLAVNFSDSKDVEDAWMKSPTHHANLVKPQFTQIGIAVANGTYKGKDATFVVQFFGAPAKTTALRTRQSVVTATSSERVLGAETESVDSNASGFFAGLIASPNHTFSIVVGTLFFVIALLLFLALIVRVRIQYLSVIFGGLLLLAIAGASLFVSETHVSNTPVELPTDTNSAAVFIGFSDLN